jgi:bacterioferritin-associated ferredoxin
VWICLCEAVNTRTICEAIESGARTVSDVSAACRAGIECGRCRVAIWTLLRQEDEQRESRT